jgi:hypothetical protein
MHLSHAIGLVALLALAGQPGRAADEPDPGEPAQKLTTFALWLRDPDREKRYQAAVGIRTWYKAQAADLAPLLLDTWAEELGLPDSPRERMADGEPLLLFYELTRALEAVATKPELVKLAKEFTQHRHPLRRAAGLWWWGWMAYDKEARVDPDELLGAVREGVKDPNRTVRTRAVRALSCFGGLGRSEDKKWTRASYPPRATDEAVRLLIAALDDRPPPRGEGFRDDEDNPSKTAFNELRYYGPPARQAMGALAEKAASKDWSVAWDACFVLHQLAERDPLLRPEVYKIVRPLIRDKQRPDNLRSKAVWCVDWSEPVTHEMMPDLIELLGDKRASGDLRAGACSALGRMGPVAVRAIPLMIEWLEETKETSQARSIVYNLRLIGPVAVEPLAKWLQTTARVEEEVKDDAVMALIALRKK